MRNMENTIWFGIFMGIVEYAAAILIAIGGVFFALTCFAWAIKMYDMLKEQCSLEKLLDTPQKREDLKLEVNTTYCYPQDEGPLTRICPECGALYPSFKVICEEDKQILQPFRKPITEPLPTLTATDETAAKLDTLIQEIDETEQQFEDELEKVRHELEEKAYYYNRKRPYTFTEQETLSIYNLYTRVKMQSHEEGKKAS